MRAMRGRSRRARGHAFSPPAFSLALVGARISHIDVADRRRVLLEELARLGLQAAEHRRRHGEAAAGQGGRDVHGLAVDVYDLLARAADPADRDGSQVQLDDDAGPETVLAKPCLLYTI